MAGNVVHAFGSTPPDEHQGEIIDLLEAALTNARAGILSGVAVVEVQKDGAATSVWRCADAQKLMGAVCRMQYRMAQSFDDE